MKRTPIGLPLSQRLVGVSPADSRVPRESTIIGCSSSVTKRHDSEGLGETPRPAGETLHPENSCGAISQAAYAFTPNPKASWASAAASPIFDSSMITAVLISLVEII